MQKKILAIMLVIAIAIIAVFLFAYFSYRARLIGNVIMEKDNIDNCKIEDFNVSSVEECKAKCLIAGTEEFNYKPSKSYGGTCTCAGEC